MDNILPSIVVDERRSSHSAAEPLLSEPSHDVSLCDSEVRRVKAGATVPQAIFVLVNIYIGSGLLSMPYALAQCGWLGLPVLALVTGIFCLSGKLIIQAFTSLPSGVPHAYPELGVAVMGPKGKYVVAAFAIFEFFGGSCLTLMVLWRQVITILPSTGLFGFSSLQVAFVGSVAALAPVLLLPSFTKISSLAFMGCLSTVLVVLVAIGTVADDPLRHHMPLQPPPRHDLASWSLFKGIGIFAVSVSGHSSLPAVRNSMQRPQAFDHVLAIAFGSMLAVYGLVAGLGYYYFGRDAATLVTSDLATDTPFAGKAILVPGLTVANFMAGCVLLNAYTTYPSLLLVIQDMLWSVLPHQGHRLVIERSVSEPVMGGAFRLLVFAAGGSLALLAFGLLGNVMSMVGGICSICCSLLLPSAFYLVLFWRQMRPASRAGVAAVLVLGVVMLGLITAQNVVEIRHRLHTPAGAGGLQQASLEALPLLLRR